MTDAGAAGFAAVDLGASSGRVIVGNVTAGAVHLTEVNRFPNQPVRVAGTLHWDVLGLFRGVLDGLRAAVRTSGPLASVGIDSWAVDYGLLDAAGSLVGNPVHYRDHRTDGVREQVLEQVPAAELYAVTGIQPLPFNTLFQLVAARATPALASARTLLLVPDLFTYWLTGVIGAEITNASTTQLLDVRDRAWATGVMTAFGIDGGLFPALRHPGANAGDLVPEMLAEVGQVDPLPVTVVGSHDTASAVVAVPAAGNRFAFVSCGTWSLVGLELPAPVQTADALAAGFTNEVGVDGTIRFLRNVMGLWLLQESIRTWNARGLPADLDSLLRSAAQVAPFTAVVDPDDPAFLAPGDVPARIARACERTGQTPPQNQAETVRCILDSLALAYRAAVRDAQTLSGREVEAVHIVGGGSRNELLCQLTADACGLPVIAGPVEAAALGNVLVQARAGGVVSGGLADLRALVARSFDLRRYEPAGAETAWAAAERRVRSSA
ncbi:MAG TPA: rhamnulokinase family protein [Actinomycetes bacterium]